MFKKFTEEEDSFLICPKCNEGGLRIDSKNNTLFKCDRCHVVTKMSELVSNNLARIKKELMIAIPLFIAAIMIILCLMYVYVKDFPINQ